MDSATLGCVRHGVVDLEWKDGVPPALDHFLLSADDIEISVVIDVTDIARSQPPFPEGAIGLRAEILTNDTGTPQQNFPINPRRCFPLRIIKDEKLGVDRDANRAKLALPWRKQIGAYRRRGLGEAIGFE